MLLNIYNGFTAGIVTLNFNQKWNYYHKYLHNFIYFVLWAVIYK
jgi:hypothetical protein